MLFNSFLGLSPVSSSAFSDVVPTTVLTTLAVEVSITATILSSTPFLNIEVDKKFADHLMVVQKDPDRYFV